VKAVQKAPAIRDLALFDTCVTLGRVCTPGVPEFLTAENVLGVMDKYDIAEALVHSSEARIVWPRLRGNERLLKDIEGQPRLHPVWVLTPPEKSDPAGCRKVVDDMLTAGVRAARLRMGIVPPLHWVWQDLCEALEEHRVPCLLDFAKPLTSSTACVPSGWEIDGVREIALAHPDLPIILSHASGGLGLNAATLPLMHRVPNLVIDVTAIVDYWRRVAREIGPERVVFASGMPFYAPGILVSNVQYALDLSDEQKRMICGDNVRRLLEAVR